MTISEAVDFAEETMDYMENVLDIDDGKAYDYFMMTWQMLNEKANVCAVCEAPFCEGCSNSIDYGAEDTWEEED